jgi:hypothetical protein
MYPKDQPEDAELAEGILLYRETVPSAFFHSAVNGQVRGDEAEYQGTGDEQSDNWAQYPRELSLAPTQEAKGESR